MSKQYLVFLSFIFMALSTAQAQVKNAKGDDLENGSSTRDIYENAQKSQKSSKNNRKPYMYLVYHTKGILYGNPCVTEKTRAMGFEYLLMCNGEPKGKEKLYAFFYNRMTSMGIFFRSGPFWRHRLKKRIAACKSSTGDYTY